MSQSKRWTFWKWTRIGIRRRCTVEVIIKETTVKSILLKHKKIDSWFISRYGMNLYRGCTHNCVYCDGRSEQYHVEGIFGENVEAKTNAVEILRKELNPLRKRVKLKPGYIMLEEVSAIAISPSKRSTS